jgi:hypothetical protein
VSVSVSGGPGSCRGTRTASTASSSPRSRASARTIDRYTRTVAGARRSGAATARRSEVPAVASDRVRIEMADHGWAAELGGQPVAEGAEDRPVLPPGARDAGGNPLGLAEQVALNKRSGKGGGEGERVPVDATEPTLEMSSASTSSSSASTAGASEGRVAHGERLFPKRLGSR